MLSHNHKQKINFVQIIELVIKLRTHSINLYKQKIFNEPIVSVLQVYQYKI